MPRLRTIGAKLGRAPAKLKSASQIAQNYGNGRGGRPWRRKREAILKRDRYLCVPCADAGRVKEATQVDHRVPEAEGGTDHESNLQSICTECHDAKTQAEAARGLARRLGS